MSIVKLNNEYMLQTLILERAKCKKNGTENIPYQNVKIHDYEEDEYELSISEDIEKHRDIINQEEAKNRRKQIIQESGIQEYVFNEIIVQDSAFEEIIDEPIINNDYLINIKYYKNLEHYKLINIYIKIYHRIVYLKKIKRKNSFVSKIVIDILIHSDYNNVKSFYIYQYFAKKFLLLNVNMHTFNTYWFNE